MKHRTLQHRLAMIALALGLSTVMSVAGCGVAKKVLDVLKDYNVPVSALLPDGIGKQALDADGDGDKDDVGFDVDGDGKVDVVDIDADGSLDAIDFDGDGQFTSLDSLLTGNVEGDFDGDGEIDKPDDYIPAPDPSVIPDVDPDRPAPRPADGSTGGSSGGSTGGTSGGTTGTSTGGTTGASTGGTTSGTNGSTTGGTTGTPTVIPRVVSLADKFPTPGNQGQLGSCAAWTSAAAATYLRAVRENGDPNQLWASASFLYRKMLDELNKYYQANNKPTVQCDSGTALYHGMQILTLGGSPSLTTVPYSATQCVTNPVDTEAHKFRIGSFVTLYPFRRDEAKAYLRLGYPIVFGASLPPNFQEWAGPKAKNEVFKSNDGQLNNKHGAGHAMVIIGYDDDKGAYQIQNSWGTDWGDRGRFFWDYADLEGRGSFNAMVAVPPKTAPQPLGPPSSNNFAFAAGYPKGARYYQQASNTTRIVFAVETNEPLNISTVSIDGPSDGTLQVGQAMSSGFVTFTFNGNAAAGSYAFQLNGQLRDGTPVTRNAQVSVADAGAR